jgi:hypothetical protein
MIPQPPSSPTPQPPPIPNTRVTVPCSLRRVGAEAGAEEDRMSGMGGDSMSGRVGDRMETVLGVTRGVSE